MGITSTAQITDWQETTETEYSDLRKTTKAIVKQKHTGDLDGESTIEYTMHYLSGALAHFLGFEFFQSDTAELVLKHSGKFENGVASSDFVIVFSSVANLPTNTKGKFKSIENGQAEYSFL